MTKTLIAGNWKMNLTVAQASLLAQRLQEHSAHHRDVEVVIAPSSLALQPLSLQIDHRKFKLASQDAYDKDEGAFTGQISFTMLRGLVSYGIIGHSERRHVFGETLDDVKAKVAAAYRNGITPILCVGETKTERIQGETSRVLHDQITSAVANCVAADIEKLVVAYEPVWAIGTGEVAKPDQAEKAAKTIRNNIAELYGKEVADGVRVLYGGSVTKDFAGGFLRAKGINGLLVGGASLNYQQFSGIIESAHMVQHGLKNKEDY
jgi:triosephosphate isomerase